MISTIYGLFFSKHLIIGWHPSINRCRSLIYHLFQGPTENLQCHFHLPTIGKRYKKKCLSKCMKNIQLHESVFIKCVLRNMSVGQSNNTITLFLDNDCRFFFINNVNSFLTSSLTIVIFTLLLNSLLYF